MSDNTQDHLAMSTSQAPCGEKAVERFTHEPRAPYIPSGGVNQRHFGRDNCDPVAGVARVFRFTERATATLELRMYSDGNSAYVTARMTPDQLRDLAQRLLDAAHNINSEPVVVAEGATA